VPVVGSAQQSGLADRGRIREALRGFRRGNGMDERHRFELHSVRFLIAQQKAKLARIEKEGTDQVEIDRAKTTLTWYEASLRRLTRR
jgi:hypothetical protein